MHCEYFRPLLSLVAIPNIGSCRLPVSVAYSRAMANSRLIYVFHCYTHPITHTQSLAKKHRKHRTPWHHSITLVRNNNRNRSRSGTTTRTRTRTNSNTESGRERGAKAVGGITIQKARDTLAIYLCPIWLCHISVGINHNSTTATAELYQNQQQQ